MRKILFLLCAFTLNDACTGLEKIARSFTTASTALGICQGGYMALGACKNHIADRDIADSNATLEAFDEENPVCRPACCNNFGNTFISTVSRIYDKSIGRCVPYRPNKSGLCTECITFFLQTILDSASIATLYANNHDNYEQAIALDSIAIMAFAWWFGAGFCCLR